MPLVSGELLGYGIASGLPMMLSANAFARLDKDRDFVGFNVRAAAALPSDGDFALDSAGYTAAALFGDYRWGVSQYYDLVEAAPWTWHSAMDLCVEEQVAGNAAVRRLRIDVTVARYFECRAEAARRGCAAPVPALQGRYADDYARCAEQMSLPADLTLVGVGSVCRRHLHGPDGLLAIVEALDQVLPSNTKLHLYGAKAGALKALRERGLHQRIHSLDSMAWDFGARCATRTGRTQYGRAQAMVEWHRRQSVDMHRAGHRSPEPLLSAAPRERAVEEVAGEAVGAAMGRLCAFGEISYRDAKGLLVPDVPLVQALLRMHGVAAFQEEEPEDDFGLGVVYGAVREALVEAGHLAAPA